MPYNVDKKEGGDNPSNTKFMESCVSSVNGTNKRTGKPYTKSEKIAICKAQLSKKKAKSELLEFVEVDESVVNRVEDIIFSFAEMLYKNKKAPTLTDAYLLTEVYLERCDYNVEILRLVKL